MHAVDGTREEPPRAFYRLPCAPFNNLRVAEDNYTEKRKVVSDPRGSIYVYSRRVPLQTYAGVRVFLAQITLPTPSPCFSPLALNSGRWTVTFLELAANVPKLSIAATAFDGNSAIGQEENSLAMVNGGVGVVSVGAETEQEASADCCVGGDFSLTFDGTFALDIDLESDANTLSASYMAEGLRDVINAGTR